MNTIGIDCENIINDYSKPLNNKDFEYIYNELINMDYKVCDIDGDEISYYDEEKDSTFNFNFGSFSLILKSQQCCIDVSGDDMNLSELFDFFQIFNDCKTFENYSKISIYEDLSIDKIDWEGMKKINNYIREILGKQFNLKYEIDIMAFCDYVLEQ